jgi:hypothetical protein
MAEMRLRARLLVLLATVLVFALPAVAGAAIKPIPKPETPVAPATPPPPPPPAAPVNRPEITPPPPPPATPPAPQPAPPVDNTPPADTTPVEIVVVGAEGGRDQAGVPVPVAPPPDPTPLALVAATETVPSQDRATPAWKIALLALLAAGEAFLIVRLVRHRPGGLSPAQ